MHYWSTRFRITYDRDRLLYWQLAYKSYWLHESAEFTHTFSYTWSLPVT